MSAFCIPTGLGFMVPRWGLRIRGFGLGVIELSAARCLWGEIALVHCALFVPSLSQYFSSAFGDDYKTDLSKQQRLERP